MGDPARRETLDRFLLLNHERYAEEVKQGLHKNKGKKKDTEDDEPHNGTLYADYEQAATGCETY